MTNQITEAFKSAGLQPVKIPANKRVWLWLRDHPNKTYKEVAAALGMEQTRASAVLHELKKRGMLVIVGDISKGMRHGRNGQSDKKIQRFSCKHKEWELLPMAVKKKQPPLRGPGVTYAPTQKLMDVLGIAPPQAPLTLMQQAHAKCLAETGIDATDAQIVAMTLRKYLGEMK